MRRGRLAAILAGLGLAAGCAPGGADERSPRDAAAVDTGAPQATDPTAGPAGPDATGSGEAGGPGAIDPDAIADGGAARPPGIPADTVVIASRGPELAFHPDRISAESGSVVIVRYENGGDLPHNFVLVRNDEAIDGLAAAAYEAAGTGYVPLDMRDDIIAFSPLISPGGTADLEIVIPPPGEYTYICLFPGHSQMMLGTLRSLP